MVRLLIGFLDSIYKPDEISFIDLPLYFVQRVSIVVVFFFQYRCRYYHICTYKYNIIGFIRAFQCRILFPTSIR